MSALFARAGAGAPRWDLIAGKLALALVLLLVWQEGARLAGPLYLATPAEVLARLAEIAVDGTLRDNTWATLRLSLTGFVFGAVPGVVLPFLLNRSARLTAALDPYIVGSMGIPKYALAPLFILWFGIGGLPKLVLVGLTVFYILYITTFTGIRAVDARLVAMARIAGASEWRIARAVVFPSLLPYFFTGMKLALPRAVSAAIVGELLVATEGIGFYIETARQTVDIPGVTTGVLLATTLVLVINAVANRLERHMLRWRHTSHDMTA